MLAFAACPRCARGFEDFAGGADLLCETVGEGEFDALAFGGWEARVDTDLLGELV